MRENYGQTKVNNSMNRDLLYSIATTGFAVAFLHAAIPTHWLPFVLTGKAQGWTRSRTMAVTALAGGGHVLFTAVLGVLVAIFGVAMDRWTGQVFPYIAAAVLFALGAFYLARQINGTGHGHSHFGHGHGHDHSSYSPSNPRVHNSCNSIAVMPTAASRRMSLCRRWFRGWR